MQLDFLFFTSQISKTYSFIWNYTSIRNSRVGTLETVREYRSYFKMFFTSPLSIKMLLKAAMIYDWLGWFVNDCFWKNCIIKEANDSFYLESHVLRFRYSCISAFNYIHLKRILNIRSLLILITEGISIQSNPKKMCKITVDQLFNLIRAKDQNNLLLLIH